VQEEEQTEKEKKKWNKKEKVKDSKKRKRDLENETEKKTVKKFKKDETPTDINKSSWTVNQLKDYCRQNGIIGYNNKKKAELVSIVSSHSTGNANDFDKDKH